MRILMLLLPLVLAFPPQDASGARHGDLDVLRERAEAYWRARLANSPDTDHFYAPQQIDRRVARGGALRLRTAWVGDIEITDDTAVVATVLQVDRFSFPMNPRMAKTLSAIALLRTREIRHPWRLVDGVWYRATERPFGGLFRRRSPAARIDSGVSK